ncbi:uncharacterized protein [Aquarana catesbeiana]|uniref:uncharacterized protein isoform X1 n=1 Tax=Aquarana catesbeiana TaxID=8400 RepID=UPI003CC94D9A
MSEVYRISSSDRIQSLEKQLASQLSELKTEIEENGILCGTPGQAYSSVPIPKDISYFRNEREMILKRGLQVAGVKPVIVQADVMQRELETCLRKEYTEDNLPLLLHQFFIDRIHHLVQSKYLNMLRWKRFCRHTRAMEECYPQYQKQIGYIMQEYFDVVQRAQRLSIAREHLITGKKNSIHLVTVEDLIIYLQWLICHLHSVKPIFNYIRTLQHLPVSNFAETVIESHYKDKECQNLREVKIVNSSEQNSADGTKWEGYEDLPQHQTGTENIKLLLRDLLSNFKVDYDVENLKNTASELDLLSLVTSKFRTIFKRQQTMRTFPVYDSGMETKDGWGFKGPHMAFKKIANWLPFVKIKPKKDPWQQKFLIKLKQHKKVDELLHLQSQFIEVTSAEKAMEVLQEHAAQVIQPSSVHSVSVKNTHDIWVKIYTPLDLLQDVNTTNGSPLQESSDKDLNIASLNRRPVSSRQKKQAGYSFQNTLQLLGLDEAEDNSKDPVMMKGAYLSLLYLRHLRVKELQRTCLGHLNYFRSVERTLTIDNSSLVSNSGNLERCAGEETSWVTAAQGGLGVPGGLRSHQYMHQTPADFKVHSVQFMEFSDVENHNDYYIIKDGIIHTQDQKGAFIVYDVAFDDLQELQHQLLLLATLFIEKERNFKASKREVGDVNLADWAHINVDRFALLLNLWTWECALLENKQQLVDCYYEAYQHVCDPEEKTALAQVITDIMFRRPRFDIGSKYFLEAYRDECQCLRLHLQLVRNVLNNQIESQREFVEKVWRDGRKGSFYDFGLPLNIITKPTVSLNTSSPALNNVYLLEIHPSLGLAYLIPKTLEHICEEFVHSCMAKLPKEVYSVEKRVLELALNEWSSQKDLQSSFMANVHKDLFEEVLVEDPLIIRDICVHALNSADEERKHGTAKQIFILETFSKMIELITLRHRIIETSLETALLSRTYTYFAEEMGFNEFHLHLRPVQFEFATYKAQADQIPPAFITSLLEDDTSVDRYSPSALLLAIHEVDDNQIGKFSFWTKEGILQLLSKNGVENLQVVLSCQVIQKNTLIAATQLAFFCQMSSWLTKQVMDTKDSNFQRRMSSSSEKTSSSWSVVESQTSLTPVPNPNGTQAQTYWTKKRYPEAFISIQLEKVGPRDAMLNTFLQKKQIMGTIMRNPEEAEKVKRELVKDYCQKLSRQIHIHSLRGQIIANCNSLKQLLEDFPLIEKTYFIIGQHQEKKTTIKEAPQADARTFQERPHALLTDDGKVFVNLWYIPFPTEVLEMFKMLPEKAAHRALYCTLQIVAALHDIVSYVLSFAQLGNSCGDSRSLKNMELTADWGGIEGIGAELRDIQNLIDGLQNPHDPKEVASLLLLRREVMILQFDAAVRHLIRDALLSTGNISAFRTTTDNMYHGLTALSDSVVRTAFSSMLPVPQPLDPRSHRTFMLYPWRTFLANGGLFPLTVNGIHTIGHYMQLCLCDMTDHERSVAHGELVGVHLLMEDILQGKYNFISFTIEGNLDEKKMLTDKSPAGEEQRVSKSSQMDQSHQDPISEYRQLSSFLILWKQLEVFKERWAKKKLRVEEINTIRLYRQFCEMYREEIFYPTMKAIARQMGKEGEFEGLTLRSQVVLPPKGASEIDIRVQQLQKIMESFESDMILDVQKKIAKEITLVVSERTREGRGLPTDLWKKPAIKENFFPDRPEIVEEFVQQLMSEHQDNPTEVIFRKEHLEQCLTSLACNIMARERSNYEAYSMFYENLLQQEHQLLYQKEQEMLAVTGGEQRRNENEIYETADITHDLIVEITALRAKLQDTEEEAMAATQVVRRQVQDEYEALVRTLFAACVSLKSKIDGYHINMNKQVTELISDVRKEGVDNMILLRKKYGSLKNESTLKDTLSMHDRLHSLRDENSQLQALICKLKSLNKWKMTAREGKLREKLGKAETEAVQDKKESLKLKLRVEQEVTLLRQELVVARKALSRTQADASKVKQQLVRQKQLLDESEYRHLQEARSRQQLDSVMSASMDKLLVDIGDKEQKLRSLTEEADRSTKMSQIQQSKVKKEVKQIKSQLVQERTLKCEAFQRVDELQTQVYEMEVGSSLRNTPVGMRKTSASIQPHKIRSYSAVTSAAPLHFNREAWDIVQYVPRTETRASTHREMRLQRPKTVPSRCRVPELMDSTSQAILTQLNELRLNTK